MGDPRRKKRPNSSPPKGKARLNLLLDEELKDWVHDYSRKRQTTVTALVVEFFIRLRRDSYGTGVKQI